jgi:hypothetical protein
MVEKNVEPLNKEQTLATYIMVEMAINYTYDIIK